MSKSPRGGLGRGIESLIRTSARPPVCQRRRPRSATPAALVGTGNAQPRRRRVRAPAGLSAALPATRPRPAHRLRPTCSGGPGPAAARRDQSADVRTDMDTRSASARRAGVPGTARRARSTPTPGSPAPSSTRTPWPNWPTPSRIRRAPAGGGPAETARRVTSWSWASVGCARPGSPGWPRCRP